MATEQVNEFGERFFGTKYLIWYKDHPDDKGFKKAEVRAKNMMQASSRAVGLGGNKFVYKIELAEGQLKIAESNLPNGVRITPVATQRKWINLTEKATSKWSLAKDELEGMWYNADLFMGVDKYIDGTVDLLWNYPLTGPENAAFAIKITARDYDSILKDPVRWLIERFGTEKAYTYLQRVKSPTFWDSGTIRKIFSPIKKEVAEASGVTMVEEAAYSFNKIKKDPKSWYNDIQMLGHRWAKDTLDMIERVVNKNGASDWQKYIIANTVNFELSGPNSWNALLLHFSKKYLSHIQFCLRNGGKMSAFQLLLWRSSKSGYLKDNLDWALEYSAYKHDTEKYTAWYSRTMGFYGLPADEAAHRLKKYIETQIAPKIELKNLA